MPEPERTNSGGVGRRWVLRGLLAFVIVVIGVGVTAYLYADSIIEHRLRPATIELLQRRFDSEVELVKSETTLLKVIDQLKLVDDPEFGVELGLKDTILAFLRLAPSTPPTGDDALQAVMDKLRDALTVQRRGLTFLISISARSRNPQMAAKIANTVADDLWNALGERIESFLAGISLRDVLDGIPRSPSSARAVHAPSATSLESPAQ